MLTTLAQVICDPVYRKFDGLRALVHKEWHFYSHNFQMKGLVLVDGKHQATMSEFNADEGSLMGQALAFFSKAKPDKTSILTQGHDAKVDPIFILLLDALHQLVEMNPLVFEYKSSYLAFIASEVHTNRFWEFVQSTRQDDDQPALPSIFAHESRLSHKNRVYHADKVLQQEPLQYQHRHVVYWSEHFERFKKPAVVNMYSKEAALETLVQQK